MPKVKEHYKLGYMPDDITQSETPVRQVFTRDFEFDVELIMTDDPYDISDEDCTVKLTVQETYDDDLNPRSKVVTKLDLKDVPEVARTMVGQRILEILKEEGYTMRFKSGMKKFR